MAVIQRAYRIKSNWLRKRLLQNASAAIVSAILIGLIGFIYACASILVIIIVCLILLK